MIAAIKTPRGLCIVLWTGKSGLLSVKTKAYCGVEVDAGDGVLQVPDNTKVCEACERAVIEHSKVTFPQKPSA